MKPDTYYVYFDETTAVRVTALNQKSAEILAQAHRIKAGLTYDVVKTIKL